MFDIRSPAHRSRIGDVRDVAIGADEDRGKLDRLAGEHIDVARGGDDGLPGAVLRLHRERSGSRQRRRGNDDSTQKTAELHSRFHVFPPLVSARQLDGKTGLNRTAKKCIRTKSYSYRPTKHSTKRKP